MSASTAKPPADRTSLWRGINEGAAARELRLQACAACGTVQYPPREVCRNCLGDTLRWQAVDGGGVVLASTRQYASVEPFFQERLPVHMGSVRLDCGPILICFLDERSLASGSRVQVCPRLDESGQAVMAAAPAEQ